MNTQEIIALARRHMTTGNFTDASAQICYIDALHLMERGLEDFARRRALKSLEHSIGILHPDYLFATSNVEGLRTEMLNTMGDTQRLLDELSAERNAK